MTVRCEIVVTNTSTGHRALGVWTFAREPKPGEVIAMDAEGSRLVVERVVMRAAPEEMPAAVPLVLLEARRI